MKAVILALCASAGFALAPQASKTTRSVASVEEGRRAFVTQVAGAMAAGILAPGVAHADGAVSKATVARSRGIYGGRVLDLDEAVKKGDFAAVLDEKNAFELFNSGAYMTKGEANKEGKAAAIAEYKNIMTAVAAKDKEGLQKSYAAYVKNANIVSQFPSDLMSGQGYSTEYDWKKGTKKGTIYQR
mmetsp:Transcript_28361/g.95490  ORF Transcript_28361/g.95490 Transcript_28361/m.95490 type:complete len:186 (+) Transcript_28361:63-620(+)